jgi:catechol 2,3-dioxygenase-like lactoylglutathione lyase family enzyme
MQPENGLDGQRCSGTTRRSATAGDSLAWMMPAFFVAMPRPHCPDFQGAGRWRSYTTFEESPMLGNREAVANLAVKDVNEAKRFYEGALGLKQVSREGDELIVFQSGHSTLNVYRSEEAGTNKATAVTWSVGNDVDGVVKELKAKGVRFEHYDMPGLKREGDLHIGGDMKVAWFKDPDGNILNIINA